MLSLSAFATSVSAAAPKPTIVLVHGAFASPAGWGPVTDASAQGRLPDGDTGARPGFGGGRRGDRAVDAGFDPGRQDLGGTLLRRVRDHQRRHRRKDVRALVYTAAYVPDDTDYDWRTCEAKLNALPHFITEIDGLDIHFIHVRSQHEDALP